MKRREACSALNGFVKTYADLIVGLLAKDLDLLAGFPPGKKDP